MASRHVGAYVVAFSGSSRGMETLNASGTADAWLRVSLVGIELVTVDARVVVASIATYFEHSDAPAELPETGAPARRVFAAGASAAHLSPNGSRAAYRRLVS